MFYSNVLKKTYKILVLEKNTPKMSSLQKSYNMLDTWLLHFSPSEIKQPSRCSLLRRQKKTHGFNPFETYDRQIGSFPPNWGEKIKNAWNNHPGSFTSRTCSFVGKHISFESTGSRCATSGYLHGTGEKLVRCWPDWRPWQFFSGLGPCEQCWGDYSKHPVKLRWNLKITFLYSKET